MQEVVGKMESFYSKEEIKNLGFHFCGENVKISRKASIYGAERISIDDNARIDDFCILSGKIRIGKYVHVAAYSALYGGDTGIELWDFSGISSRCAIYAESDDYSGEHMAHPTINIKYRGVIAGEVVLERHSILGTGTTVLPGVRVKEGSAVGCMSLVSKTIESWGIYAGIPCHKIKDRKKNLLELERKFLQEQVDINLSGDEK